VEASFLPSTLIAFKNYFRFEVSLGLPLVALAGALGIQIFRMLRTVNDQIAVDESGIWRVPRKGAPMFIVWNEVGGLKHTRLFGRLIVIDTSGTRKIELSSRLDNFDELSQFVSEHTKTRPAVTRTRWPVNDWAIRAKAVVKVLYVSLRFLFLPLILVFRLAGLRPETVVATYTLCLFFIILPMAQARIGLGLALALTAAGVLLAYLFLVWGKEFERR
jgi:hypothetical protein